MGGGASRAPAVKGRDHKELEQLILEARAARQTDHRLFVVVEDTARELLGNDKPPPLFKSLIADVSAVGGELTAEQAMIEELAKAKNQLDVVTPERNLALQLAEKAGVKDMALKAEDELKKQAATKNKQAVNWVQKEYSSPHDKWKKPACVQGSINRQIQARDNGDLCVSMAFLEAFVASIPPDLVSCGDVVDQIVKPLTKKYKDDTAEEGDLKRYGCRFVDLLGSSHVKPVDQVNYFYFLSHAWGVPLSETVAMIKDAYIKKEGISANNVWVWVDMFCLPQNAPPKAKDTEASVAHGFAPDMRKAIENADFVLLDTTTVNDDDAPLATQRSWCLFELWTTLRRRAPTKDGGQGQEVVLKVMTRASGAGLITLSAAVDLEMASASDPKDKKQIEDDIKKSGFTVQEINKKIEQAIFQQMR